MFEPANLDGLCNNLPGPDANGARRGFYFRSFSLTYQGLISSLADWGLLERQHHDSVK
jgi:hypothetical protein